MRRGCTFHGLAFNIDMDLEPFSRINPCGFAGLEVIRLSDLAEVEFRAVEDHLVRELAEQLGYDSIEDAEEGTA